MSKEMMTTTTTAEPSSVPTQARKELEAMVAGIVSGRPNLKDSLTIAAAWYFLQLPDKSYGWTANTAMERSEKMLGIALHLQLGLMPGIGQLYFLGHKWYISTDALREKAKPFITKRTPRPCTTAELEMLGFSSGDKAIAVDFELSFGGESPVVETTGYGIIEKAQLDFRSNGKTNAGLANKKDIFQTLCTRAERDVYKHHIPVSGVSIEPDLIDRTPILEAEIQPVRNRLPSPNAKPIAHVHDEKNKATLDAESVRLRDLMAAEIANRTDDETQKLCGMTRAELLDLPARRIEAALEVLRDVGGGT